jgi:hypothetical protein
MNSPHCLFGRLRARRIATIEDWIATATAGLAPESIARARADLEEHFASACADRMASGQSEAASRLLSLEAMGDPLAANRAYRQALLTESDSNYLRQVRGDLTPTESLLLRLAVHVFPPVFFVSMTLIGLRESPPTLAAVVGLTGLAIGFLTLLSKAGLIRGRAIGWTLGLVLLAMLAGAFMLGEGIRLTLELLFGCTVLGVLYLLGTRSIAKLRPKVPPKDWPEQLS